jgi:hypothetical protein
MPPSCVPSASRVARAHPIAAANNNPATPFRPPAAVRLGVAHGILARAMPTQAQDCGVPGKQRQPMRGGHRARERRLSPVRAISATLAAAFVIADAALAWRDTGNSNGYRRLAEEVFRASCAIPRAAGCRLPERAGKRFSLATFPCPQKRARLRPSRSDAACLLSECAGRSRAP